MDNNINQHSHNKTNENEIISTGPKTTPLNDAPYIPGAYSPGNSAYTARSQDVASPKKQRGGIMGLMLAGTLALGMLLGGAGAEAVTLLAQNNAPAVAQATVTTSTSEKGGSAEPVSQIEQATIGSIYKQISPSVVRVTARVQTGGRMGMRGEGTGTGVVIDDQGHILTNYHVVQGASSLRIELADGSEHTASVVGTAPQDDLAILKADAPSGVLVPARLGDSSALQVGDEVLAVGYPYGLDQSITAGIVSGLNRQGSGSNGGRTLTGLIQVDAAINPGNSGGPLLNAEGLVIGINTMIESPVEGFTGVGLAIPINTVKGLLSQLEQGGQVQRPWIGISGAEITTSLKEEHNLPVSGGILIVGVAAGSPAEDAGLRPATISNSQGQISSIGDIIVAIDGQKVRSVADLTRYLNGKRPGDKVTLSIVRDGQQQDVTVTLEPWSVSSTGSAG